MMAAWNVSLPLSGKEIDRTCVLKTINTASTNTPTRFDQAR